MKKNENLELVQDNDKLKGGFMSLNSEKMSKIKGGKNSNPGACYNSGTCTSTNSGTCTNKYGCSEAVNTGTCRNS